MDPTNDRSTTRWLHLFATTIAAAALGGCVTDVIVGAGGGDGSGGATAAVVTAASGAPADGPRASNPGDVAQATWQLYGDMPTTVQEEVCPISPCDFAADTRIVVVDSRAPICEAPFRYSMDADQSPGWRCVIGLPTEKQVPGSYDVLANPDIGVQCWSWYVEAQPTGEGSSGAVGGPAFQGNVEVVSIDEQTMVVRIAGMFDGMRITDGEGNELRPFDVSNGEYTAVACAD